MTDTIVIRELEVWYRVGVPDDERDTPQRLLVTIEMSRDFSEAESSDDLTKTIDYHAVSQRLLRLGEGRSWNRIETLAIAVAEMVLKDFGAQQVAVEVPKYVIAQTSRVAVKVVRPRSER